MNLSELSDQEIENRLQEVKANVDQVEKWQMYDGKDKVVTSEYMAKHVANQPQGSQINSKLSKLTKMTQGFREGELIVLSGITGHGKTTLAQSLTYDFADQEIQCLWFTFEVGVGDLLKRFKSGLPHFTIPMSYEANNVEWLRDRIQEAKVKYGVKVVFVDHLHYLLNLKDAQSGNSSFVIGAIMRRLKQIAVEENVVIFLIAHVKGLEDGKIPSLHDIRDSSFIGQEADMVILIARDIDVDKSDKFQRVYTDSYIKVDKSRRTGNIGSFKVVLRGGRFYEHVTDRQITM